MKLLKISSLCFTVFFVFIFATQIYAAGTPPTNVSTNKVAVTSTINIYNAKVDSVSGKIFKLSFDINNGAGAQAGLKYNVRLIQNTTKGQIIADEKTYSESFGISANSTIHKIIDYTVPTNLVGKYDLIITLENSSGLPLGLGKIAGFSFAANPNPTSTTDTIQILPETCFLSVLGEKGSPKYTLIQGVDVNPAEKILLNCTTVNPLKTSISVIPSYETHLRTMSGDSVSQENGDVTPITLKALEKKSISLTLPKATSPQAYDLKITLKSGAVSSNSIIAHYVLHGESATIQSFLLDKDYYNKKDAVKISFTWSPSADSFPGSRLGATSLSDINLVTHIVNDKNKECIAPINQVLNNNSSSVEIPTTAIVKCINPTATVELTDSKGNILDQKIFAFESKIPHLKNSSVLTVLIILGVLVALGLVVYFINLKKKSNETDNK